MIATKSSDGSLVVPDNGEVVLVGPGRQAGNGQVMQMQLKKGDKCRFRSYAGTELKIQKKEYLVIKAYDILAVW